MGRSKKGLSARGTAAAGRAWRHGGRRAARVEGSRRRAIGTLFLDARRAIRMRSSRPRYIRSDGEAPRYKKRSLLATAVNHSRHSSRVCAICPIIVLTKEM